MNKNHAVALLVSFAIGVATWTVARSVVENQKLNEGILHKGDQKASLSDDAKRYAQGDYYVDLTDEEVSPESEVVEIKVSDLRVPEEISEVVASDTTFPTPEDSADDDNEDFELLGAEDTEDEDVEQEEDATADATIIGDGEGHISRTSEEYETLISNAVVASAGNEDYRLILHGKLNGLGARGDKTGEFITDADGVEYEGKSYDAVAINKLYTVMKNKKS